MFIWQLTSILLLLCFQIVYANRLHDAVQHGRIEELRALLDSIDSRGVIQSCECYFFGSYCEPCSVDDSHRGGLTPLIYAGGLGSTDAMELLIAAGADLDEVKHLPAYFALCAQLQL